MSIEAMTWAMNATRTGPMSDGARLVLIALADYADADGRHAFPAKRRLAERLGVTERTIQRHLAALRESGHIVLGDARHVSHYLADRRPTVYDLALDRPVEPRHETRERGDSPVIGETALSPGGETERARAGRQNVHERGDSPVSQTKNLTPHTNPTPPSPPASTAREHGRTIEDELEEVFASITAVLGSGLDYKVDPCRGRIGPPVPMPADFRELVEQARLEAQAEEAAKAQTPLIPDLTKERPA